MEAKNTKQSGGIDQNTDPSGVYIYIYMYALFHAQLRKYKGVRYYKAQAILHEMIYSWTHTRIWWNPQKCIINNKEQNLTLKYGNKIKTN